MTLIHHACKEGNKEILMTLIDIYEKKHKSLDFLFYQDNKKWTPIYYAIDSSESGFPEIVGKIDFYD